MVANFALTEIEGEDKGVAVNQINCVNSSDSDHLIQFQFYDHLEHRSILSEELNATDRFAIILASNFLQSEDKH